MHVDIELLLSVMSHLSDSKKTPPVALRTPPSPESPKAPLIRSASPLLQLKNDFLSPKNLKRVCKANETNTSEENGVLVANAKDDYIMVANELMALQSREVDAEVADLTKSSPSSPVKDGAEWSTKQTASLQSPTIPTRPWSERISLPANEEGTRPWYQVAKSPLRTQAGVEDPWSPKYSKDTANTDIATNFEDKSANQKEKYGVIKDRLSSLEAEVMLASPPNALMDTRPKTQFYAKAVRLDYPTPSPKN